MSLKPKDMRNCACSIFRSIWENTIPRKWKYTPLRPPQTKVVVHYDSQSDSCTWYDHCIHMMHVLKKRYLAQGLPDIPYNFVVGADGDAYCGRGWKRQSDPCLPYSEFLGSKIDILLFGNWTDKEPPQPMRRKLTKLIEFGVELGRITKDYDLLMVDNRLWDDYEQKYSHIINNFK